MGFFGSVLCSETTGLMTREIRGIAHELRGTKRPTKRAAPLPVDAVLILEVAVLYHASAQTRVVAGFFLFCLYLSQRHGGAARLTAEPWCDEITACGTAYVEAHAEANR